MNLWNKSTFKDWRSKHEAKDPIVAVILPKEKKAKGEGTSVPDECSRLVVVEV
jgi:hypothetical protein